MTLENKLEDKQMKEQIKQTILKVTLVLIKKCTYKGRLRVKFCGDPYLGAAHGVVGVLYIIIHAWKLLPQLQQDDSIIKVIFETLNMLIGLINQFGNIPAVEGAGADACNVHWCHGAPGAIPLFCLAALTFTDN